MRAKKKHCFCFHRIDWRVDEWWSIITRPKKKNRRKCQATKHKTFQQTTRRKFTLCAVLNAVKMSAQVESMERTCGFSSLSFSCNPVKYTWTHYTETEECDWNWINKAHRQWAEEFELSKYRRLYKDGFGVSSARASWFHFSSVHCESFVLQWKYRIMLAVCETFSLSLTRSITLLACALSFVSYTVHSTSYTYL